ncbi:MAG TPA: DUF4245 domain-containing protein [Blastococcus sp.]|jgi:hypothetical protein|nr:DUF4245 domain-containing protein [Blastococcus sp.]
MTGIGPTSQRPQRPDHAHGSQAEVPPPPASAVERANRLSAANMLRSLLPLVAICLLLVGWQAFRTGTVDPVREVDPRGTIRLAESRAAYPLVVPTGLPEGYRPTSVRTDAGSAADGAPVTLQIGYVTPSENYAGFVISDAIGSEAVDRVLADSTEEGSVELDGDEWTRSTTARGETALSRVADGATVVVSGSAVDAELEQVAAAVGPYSG